MTQAVEVPEVLTRDQVIEALRAELLRRSAGEISICRLAAEQGIFCRGFRRYSDRELRKRYGWIARRYPQATREELERIADLWQLARQEVTGLPTSCDVQTVEHDSCSGWEDFPDDDLARFLYELTGRRVTVVER